MYGIGAETINSETIENLKFLGISSYFHRKEPFFFLKISTVRKRRTWSRIPACLAVYLEPWQSVCLGWQFWADGHCACTSTCTHLQLLHSLFHTLQMQMYTKFSSCAASLTLPEMSSSQCINWPFL